MTIVLIVFITIITGLITYMIKVLNEKQKLLSDFNKLLVEKNKFEWMYNSEKEKSSEHLTMIQKTMEERFENISNKVLKTQQEDLKKEQKDNLENILNPFKTQIGDFKSLIEKTNAENNVDKGYLKKHLEDLQNMNATLSKNADDLVKALKGNSKIQGDWGENQLKNILDMAGFIEGVDYTMQVNFKDEDKNRNLRPDCIVNLPDGRKVIIDSKVSITNFIDYVKAEDKELKKKYLKDHIASVRDHIKELTKKEYEKLLKDKGLDFVFMFIPNEPAYMEVLKYDSSVYEDAYKNNVAIATPSSILPVLRTIKNMWNIENQNKNASRIAEEAGKLYDKLEGFVGNMKDIEKNIDRAKESYSLAFGQLSSGKGNALSIAEKMKEMGAKTNKTIGVKSEEDVFLLDNK